MYGCILRYFKFYLINICKTMIYITILMYNYISVYSYTNMHMYFCVMHLYDTQYPSIGFFIIRIINVLVVFKLFCKM